MIEVKKICCEYKINPMGIDVVRPRLSWQIASDRKNIMQTAYQIQVSLEGNDFSFLVWDTGKVETAQSIHVEYDGSELKSDTYYFYRIKIWILNEETEWSKTACWHTGLLSAKNWLAKWIEPKGYETCPLLRKTFELNNEVERASVFVSGVGLYELRLNGQKVGQDFFTPGWTSYNNRVQYQAYDITMLLKEKNAVGLILGNGWYKGEITWHNQKNIYGANFAALVQIHIKYKNKKTDIIVSDTTWKSSGSELVSSEIYNGETYDLCMKKADWDNYDYNDFEWDSVINSQFAPKKLIGQVNNPVQIMEEIKPISIFKTPKNETVIDMGQNMVGFISIKMNGKKGDGVVLRHFEVLDDYGNVFLDNLRNAKQRDEYILNDENEICLQPRFTFHGFRYVYLEEFPQEPDINQFIGMVLYSQMDTIGFFETSNELINKLQHNILWSQKGNFVDIPSDCPQRDERLGWTGDAQIFVKTAAFNMNCASFFAKWLGDVEADQKDDGLVPWVIPDAVEKNMYPKSWLEDTGVEIPTSAGWGDAAVIVPWELYLAYGDKRVLEKQYDSMKAWVEYMRNQGENEFLWNTGFHFGDWLSLDTNYENYFGGTSHDYIATAYYAHSANILSKTAKVIGEKEDSEKYRELYNSIIKEFQNEFITKTGRLSENTQTAHIFALYFDLIEKKYEKRIIDNLEKLIKKNGYKLNTGFIGTPYLCYALSENEKIDIAMKVLLQTESPSWLYQVTKGATTIWENWDNDVKKASFNHYAFGAIGEWLYSVLGGINVCEENPGYKHSVINPKIVEEFDYISAKTITPYGDLSCAWKRHSDIIEISIIIPHNTTSFVCLPRAKSANVKEKGKVITNCAGINNIQDTNLGVTFIAGSGDYCFRYKRQ